MLRKNRPMVRRFEVVNGLVFGALFVTGIVLGFVQSPSSAATYAANNGVSTQPSQPEPLQQLHEGLASVMILIAVVGGAWLMVRIHEDWSGRLAAAAAVGMIAVVTGMMVRFEAVQIDGVFDADLRGLGFIFNPGLDQVTFGGRAFGATVYRVWVLVHAVSSVGMLVLTVLGVRDVRNPKAPPERIRPRTRDPLTKRVEPVDTAG